MSLPAAKRGSNRAPANKSHKPAPSAEHRTSAPPKPAAPSPPPPIPPLRSLERQAIENIPRLPPLLKRPLSYAERIARAKVYENCPLDRDGWEVYLALGDLQNLVDCFHLRNNKETVPDAFEAAGLGRLLTRDEYTRANRILAAMDFLRGALAAVGELLDQHLSDRFAVTLTPLGEELADQMEAEAESADPHHAR